MHLPSAKHDNGTVTTVSAKGETRKKKKKKKKTKSPTQKPTHTKKKKKLVPKTNQTHFVPTTPH